MISMHEHWNLYLLFETYTSINQSWPLCKFSCTSPIRIGILTSGLRRSPLTQFSDEARFSWRTCRCTLAGAATATPKEIAAATKEEKCILRATRRRFGMTDLPGRSCHLYTSRSTREWDDSSSVLASKVRISEANSTMLHSLSSREQHELCSKKKVTEVVRSPSDNTLWLSNMACKDQRRQRLWQA